MRTEDSSSEALFEQLVERLVTAAGAELCAYHRYTLARMTAGPELARLLDDVRAEDRTHYEILIERIHQLGGRPAAELSAFARDDPRPALPSGADPLTDLANRFTEPADPLTDLAEAKRAAVERYTAICALTEGRDPWTFAISSAILREEVEHASWLREFRGESGPSRFRPGFRGRSPYVAPIRSSADPAG